MARKGKRNNTIFNKSKLLRWSFHFEVNNITQSWDSWSPWLSLSTSPMIEGKWLSECNQIGSTWYLYKIWHKGWNHSWPIEREIWVEHWPKVMNLVKPNFLVVSSGDSAVFWWYSEMSMLPSDHVSLYVLRKWFLTYELFFP